MYESEEPVLITVETEVDCSINQVWKFWTKPEHIKQWHSASEDWQTVSAENELRVGGRFHYRKEAESEATGIDYAGEYTDIVPEKSIKFTLDDKRKVTISFIDDIDFTTIIQTFEAEKQTSLEVQKSDWQERLWDFADFAEENCEEEE